MKRIAYIFLLLLPANVFGQGRWMWGFTGGLDIAYRHEIPFESGSSSLNTGLGFGYVAGIELGYFNWNSLSISTRLEYNHRALKYNSGLIDDVEFLEVSALLKVPVVHHFYVFIGPKVAFSSTTIPTDLDLSGGFGYYAPLNNSLVFFIEPSYQYGFNDVEPPFTAELAPGAQIVLYHEYFRNIRLQFGILFGK